MNEWWDGERWNREQQCTLSNQEYESFTLNGVEVAWKAMERERKMKAIEREINENVQKHINNNKGEKKVRTIYPELEKIIFKNVETGWYHHYPVTKENESEARKLRVGQMVKFIPKHGMFSELCRVEKIIFKKPELKGTSPKGVVFSEFANMPEDYLPYSYPFTPGSLWHYPRKAGKNTATCAPTPPWYLGRFLKSKEIEEYDKKPYFLARLDTIKGKPDGKENLDKMMFPCYVIFRAYSKNNDALGQLVTGYPNGKLEYQLINLSRQVPSNQCCTVDRNTDLKVLMKRWSIEVIKGETQMWKVGGFNV